MLKSVDTIVEAFGGTTVVARRLGVGPPAVSNWRAAGVIPSEYFLVFSAWATGKRLRVDAAVFGFKAETEMR